MITIILTSILISLIFAPLGCLVLWKKYIYFGDGLSHASLLAGSLSIIIGLPLIYAGFFIATIFAFAVFKLKNTSDNNAVISLMSSLMLSLALILSYLNPSQVNINHLLFGEILAVSATDLAILFVIFIIVSCFVIKFYSKIVLIAFSQDIACTQGIKVQLLELVFLVLLSLSVFSSIKIVGALLVTSILLIPAMSARLIAHTPSQMIVISIIIALISNLFGLGISFYLDIPVAPIIIVVGAILYFLLVCFNLI